MDAMNTLNNMIKEHEAKITLLTQRITSLDTQLKVVKLDRTQEDAFKPRFDKVLREMKDDFQEARRDIKQAEKDF
jgi:hypothetical protein